jgi:hypothetical protein
MRAKTIFILNALIAAGYGVAFLAAASSLLAVYGIAPNRESIYMARWFGVGLLAVGLTTWFARNEAESTAVRAISRALVSAYAVGVVLAVWGTLFGPFNALGWIAVGFNLMLGLAFGYLAFRRPVSSRRAGASQSREPTSF